jgi:hypothetical protein
MDAGTTALLAIAAVAAVAYFLFQAAPSPGSGVQRLAQAIATAEGFYSAGSRAARNHNPGDMTQDLIGKGIGFDGPFVKYSNDADGWADLYAQIQLWQSGASNYADSSSTIEDLSDFYTTTDKTNWAANVAHALGVSIDATVGQVTA